MCGIGGIKVMEGGGAILPRHLTILALSLEHRGRDATGFALQKSDGSIEIFKRPVTAGSLVSTREYLEFLSAKLEGQPVVAALVHTRAKTKGSPTHPENNHPVSAGKAAIVHNGMLWNDDELFRELAWTRNAEVDSDIIRAKVDYHGLSKTCVEALQDCKGSAAIAALHPEYPGQVLLARDGNPIVVGGADGLLFWASTTDAIYRTQPDWVDYYGIPMQLKTRPIPLVPMADQTAWLLSDTGLEWHRPFKMAFTKRTWGGFGRVRQKLPKNVRCPGCKRVLELTKAQRGGLLSELTCTPCGAALTGAEEAR